MVDFSTKFFNVIIYFCAVHLLLAQKPGNCPTNPIDIGLTCTANCGGDESCPGEEKCCSRGCSTECSAPIFDQQNRGQGIVLDIFNKFH